MCVCQLWRFAAFSFHFTFFTVCLADVAASLLFAFFAFARVREEAGLDRQLLRRYPFASHVIAVEWSSQQHLSDKRSLLIIIRRSLITRWNESHHSPWLESHRLFRRKVLVAKCHLFYFVNNTEAPSFSWLTGLSNLSMNEDLLTKTRLLFSEVTARWLSSSIVCPSNKHLEGFDGWLGISWRKILCCLHLRAAFVENWI